MPKSYSQSDQKKINNLTSEILPKVLSMSYGFRFSDNNFWQLKITRFHGPCFNEEFFLPHIINLDENARLQTVIINILSKIIVLRSHD